MLEMKMSMPNIAQNLLDRRDEILISVMAAMQTNRALLFDQEGAYNGHTKWRPLKIRSGQILSLSGTLRRSLVGNLQGGKGDNGIAEAQNNVITIGTKVHYAAMMNYGTTGLPGGYLTPKKARVLAFPGINGKTIYASKVKIPARKFNIFNSQDRQEFSETFKNKILEVINGN